MLGGDSQHNGRRSATAELTSDPPFATVLLHDVSPLLLTSIPHEGGSPAPACPGWLTNHSSIGRGLFLCGGTLVELEAHTAASICARPYSPPCDGQRLRSLEGGRTAGVAPSREYDGRRGRRMGHGSPVELTSSPSRATMLLNDVLLLLWETKLVSLLPCRMPPFASMTMWTVRKSSKSPSELRLADSETRLSLS